MGDFLRVTLRYVRLEFLFVAGKKYAHLHRKRLEAHQTKILY